MPSSERSHDAPESLIRNSLFADADEKTRTPSFSKLESLSSEPASFFFFFNFFFFFF